MHAQAPIWNKSAPVAVGRPSGACVATGRAMSPVFDFYTIIFLALAIFIFARLRSVLGQRTGRERPPYDPYSARDNTAKSPSARDREKVVPLPGRTAEPTPRPEIDAPAPSAERWAGVVADGTPAADGLEAIAKADREFDARHFLAGAKTAYEMIVSSFAEGDRRGLKNLLAKDVFEGFAAAIADRESRGETMETRFVSIEKAEIIGAELKGKSAQVTIRFVSQLISVTRNRTGDVVDGSPDKVTDVTDIWTFAREVGSRDPNWKLIATEAPST
jgi:predicted lipid-binding transport protein (Tim44 family)